MMSAADFRVLDSPTRVTPFGARFWDAATRRFIGDELRLRAYPRGATYARAIEGFANKSGVFLLAGLPGLRALENGAGDAEYWAGIGQPPNPPRLPFRIEMEDLAGRFLPYWFDADLPKQGLYSTAAGVSSMPLFSAPARPVPAALAVVRAQLRIAGTGKPAAWAIVRVDCEGERVCTGLSDREGRVALMFAYPEPLPKHLAAPPPPPPPPPPAVAQKEWTIALEARYTPRADDEPVPHVESLERILAQPVRALLKSVSPDVELPVQTLKLGSELVVHSAGSSFLFIRAT